MGTRDSLPRWQDPQERGQARDGPSVGSARPLPHPRLLASHLGEGRSVLFKPVCVTLFLPPLPADSAPDGCSPLLPEATALQPPSRPLCPDRRTGRGCAAFSLGSPCPAFVVGLQEVPGPGSCSSAQDTPVPGTLRRSHDEKPCPGGLPLPG